MFARRLVIVLTVLLLLATWSQTAYANAGQIRYQQFIDALMGDEDTVVVFTEAEALALMQAGLLGMFEDMPLVQAGCTAVSIRGNQIEIQGFIRILGSLNISPSITFSARVAGDDVVLDIHRVRVGFVPFSVTALLGAVWAAGAPEYMTVHPWAGRIVIRKRGYVRYLTGINISNGRIRLSVAGS